METKLVRRTAARVLACYSWKGADFELKSSKPRNRRTAKRLTSKAQRRHDHALAAEELEEVTIREPAERYLLPSRLTHARVTFASYLEDPRAAWAIAESGRNVEIVASDGRCMLLGACNEVVTGEDAWDFDLDDAR